MDRRKIALTTGSGATLRRISTGTDDLEQAKAVAKRLWRSMQQPDSERVEDLWAAYIADRQVDRKNTSRATDAWKRLSPVFGRKLGGEVTKDDCRAYAALRQRHGAAVGTARTELEFLRACLNLRYGRGNTHVWTPAPSRPRDRYLTKDEVDQLLAHIVTPHVRLFVILAVTTGARMEAILQLTWSQVDFKHGRINFNRADREQTNKRRPEVPMVGRARLALQEAAAGALTDHVIEWDAQPIASIKKAIRQAAARSSVQCSPHVFRHTAAVWMAEADVPMQKISQFLGHTSVRITERVYARYSPSFMQDAAAALDW
jgi:integrase